MTFKKFLFIYSQTITFLVYSFILVFVAKNFVQYSLTNNPFSSTPYYIFFTVLFFAAFFEEFLSRYFLTYTGYLGAVWITWHTYFSVAPFLLNRYNIDNAIVDAVFILVSLGLLYLIQKYPKIRFYNQLFLPSKTKIALASIGFSLFHLTNYIIPNGQLLKTVVFLILLRTPFALYMSYIRTKYKNGFLYAVGFHFLYNILTIPFSIILVKLFN